MPQLTAIADLTLKRQPHDTQTAFDETEVLGMMPPPMARAVIKEVYQGVVADMLLFKDLDEEIVSCICLKLRPYKAHVDEVIHCEGELGTELYIVHVGFCMVSSGGMDLGTLASGAFFGETSVLGLGGGQSGRLHTRTVTVDFDTTVHLMDPCCSALPVLAAHRTTDAPRFPLLVCYSLGASVG